jgi:phage major head subunit gpT-like protein
MALVVPADIAALNVTVETKYRQAYTGTATFHDALATTIPCSTTVARLPWMGQLAQMRQWLGARVVNDLDAHVQTITPLPFEYTVAVDRHDYEDQQLGIYTPRIEDMGRAAARWPSERLIVSMQAGLAQLCFDGLSFFNAAHPLNPGGNQSNNFTTTALTTANYATVREAMMAYLGENGQPLGVNPGLLIVPPQLERQAKEIVKAAIIPDPGAVAAGVTNVNAGTAELLVLPELAGAATTWYLADTSKAVKPYAWVLRQAPLFVSKQSPDDDSVFWDREFVWGVESRGEMRGVFWPFCARCIA